MDDNFEKKEKIIQLLMSYQSDEETSSGYYSIDSRTHQQILPLMADVIKTGETTFAFDLKKHFQDIDFQLFNKENASKEYKYARQGGGDLYSYLQIKVEAITEPVLLVREDLPEFLEELLDDNCSKNQCVEWVEVYPYILKALLDYCLQNKFVGVSFTLLNIRFHPVDYKAYAYYVCARKLLNTL